MIRGYMVARKYEAIKIDMKLNKNIEYFKEMKERMKENAQVLIAYYWRKKLKRMHKKKTKGKRGRNLHGG